MVHGRRSVDDGGRHGQLASSNHRIHPLRAPHQSPSPLRFPLLRSRTVPQDLHLLVRPSLNAFPFREFQLRFLPYNRCFPHSLDQITTTRKTRVFVCVFLGSSTILPFWTLLLQIFCAFVHNSCFVLYIRLRI